ncbi:MAG TPA: hypothetical protein VFP43_22545 [Mesorhizobium sp.]|nr:hypothetical protein [Mesorhizobium sp.]
MTTLRMWTVYDHPKDYPDCYVARMFEVDAEGPRATGSIIIMESLERLRDTLAFEMHLTPMKRNPEDDPVIVETWL